MPVSVVGESFAISVLALSVLSGVGSYLQGIREQRLAGGFLNFLTELTLALVVGLIVAYLCESEGVEAGYTSALVLIASNNGADSINFIRKLASQMLARFFNTGGQGK
ncbi:hypothetical protein R7Z80_17040 [Vibrio sp. 1733]|uniref:phage holin family protein n=1 Tax=unclassified Vibrio TaxID=2614977 RepID=UPI0029640BB4|nr:MULTISPECIES: phage holin family protein [unclassified Vibrio]MDW2187564.1 hypothetical protein [Vibrio sp. 1733]MDW2237552.1 hypothetical protein [Vibrio sp. 1565-1]